MSDMTRYIDPNDIRLTADTLVDGDEAFVSIEDVRKAIQQTPAADVVERSELERCNKNYLLLKLEYAGFQAGAIQIIKDLDGEVARLKHILDSYALQYGTVTDQRAVIDKAKAEVIVEIEKCFIDSDTLPSCARLVDLDKFTELKKKHTKGEDLNNVGDSEDS